MRRIIASILVVISISYSLLAQSSDGAFKTTTEAQNYFSTNIDRINPIEGIYDVECTTIINTSTYGAFRKEERCTWAIYGFIFANGEKAYLCQQLSPTTNLVAIIRQIGETSYYKIEFNTSKGHHEIRFSMSSLYSFEYSYGYVASSYGATATSTNTVHAVKQYPTRTMYVDVQRRVEEGARVPEEWSGSGFALRDGYIVTNHHVVEGASVISVYGINGSFNTGYKAQVVASDKTNDLAIIVIDDSRFTGYGEPPYAIKNDDAEVGEDVFVLGYPLTAYMGDEIKLTTGVISSRTGYQGNNATYQISAPVQPGNSGGPLFDVSGNLIGIVNSSIPDAENVGYAIKASYLKNLVVSRLRSSLIPSKNTIVSLSRPNQVKKIKPFVFMIKCKKASSTSTSSYSGSASGAYVIGGSRSSVSRDLTIRVGERVQLMVSDRGSRTVSSWKSDNESIVRVDNDGIITGVSPGKVNVWAKLSDFSLKPFCITVTR